MSVRFPAGSLQLPLGRALRWQVELTWRDGGPCERSPSATACTQRLPEERPGVLPTRRPRGLVLNRSERLRVLATGDSMIQIVDSFLKRRLQTRGARVRSDAHISTGISKPAALNWPAKARSQARSIKPHVTVISLGANDGFPMRTARGRSAPCCEAAWIAEYSRRARRMMASYRRGGRSLVYWLTLPTPRRGNFKPIYRAVNTAVKRAATAYPDHVRVLDLGRVFTPGGRFRQHIVFRGRRINARQGDGVHLSTAGASVAATLVIDRLRADGALRSR
ncbi:MAG: DUF459 domain-containing protein [Solirubrobacterales bacterium]|nr:DUF459 domain-containing protein [Solirubrobacterales bacterium]